MLDISKRKDYPQEDSQNIQPCRAKVLKAIINTIKIFFADA